MPKNIPVKKVPDTVGVSSSKNRTRQIEKYLLNLEREVASLDRIVEETKEDIPEKIENTIKDIIQEQFKAKKFNGFIAQDLFSAYVEAGGRRLVKKMLRENPKQVFNLLKLIVEIGKDENKVNSDNNITQVIVNIS